MPTDSGDFNGTDIDDWAAAENGHAASAKENTRPEPDQGWQPL